MLVAKSCYSREAEDTEKSVFTPRDPGASKLQSDRCSWLLGARETAKLQTVRRNPYKPDIIIWHCTDLHYFTQMCGLSIIQPLQQILTVPTFPAMIRMNPGVWA